MKYKIWLDEWLTNYVEQSTKHRTFIRYKEIVEQHVKPKLGDYELTAIDLKVLQYFVTQLSISGNIKIGKGLAANSVNSIINVIQSSLKMAYKLGYISIYTADSIKRPKVNEKEIICLSIAEQKQIESAIINDKKDKMFGILLCLYTGLRIGELLELKWADINIGDGVLTVSRSCHDGKGPNGRFSIIVDTPKTISSRRTIPLPKQIMPYLRNIKKRSVSDYVVANGIKQISIRSYQRSFELLLKKLGIRHCGFHTLRHTFATRALECGMDVKTLSDILGHKSATVTLNRYVHSMLEHKKNMMNKIGNRLG